MPDSSAFLVISGNCIDPGRLFTQAEEEIV